MYKDFVIMILSFYIQTLGFMFKFRLISSLIMNFMVTLSKLQDLLEEADQ